MTQQAIVEELLLNTKILSISILYGTDSEPYACIEYQDKNQSIHDILVDLPDLHLLLNKFTVSSIHGNSYVRLTLPNGYKYLHQAISEAPAGHVTHHTRFTCDNRRKSLQIIPRGIHSQFHRYMKIKQTRKEFI